VPVKFYELFLSWYDSLTDLQTVATGQESDAGFWRPKTVPVRGV
jgi:hypothetical protein